ncbi:MAG: hypothetical protein SP1CHLAM54_15020 [Chlamydiia bacterium]|nr:hypothetical protein [Chlamydiia bacterium]MCH9616392.1 hypothetical protein [Chlamydiia bacterium]MCH9629622.1 hypothetical protein [Chlamydiia bacterium]
MPELLGVNIAPIGASIPTTPQESYHRNPLHKGMADRQTTAVASKVVINPSVRRLPRSISASRVQATPPPKSRWATVMNLFRRTKSAPTTLKTRNKSLSTMRPYNLRSTQKADSPRYSTTRGYVTANPAHSPKREARVSREMMEVRREIVDMTGEHPNIRNAQVRKQLRQLADLKVKQSKVYNQTLTAMKDQVMTDHGVPVSQQGWKARAKRLLKGATPTAKEIVMAVFLALALGAVGL